MSEVRRSVQGYISKFGEDSSGRTVTAVVTDGTKDRMNDIVVPEGVRFKNYLETNAVVLWAHDSDHPIAKCIHMSLADGQVTGTARFARPGISQKADEIYDLIKDGVVNTVSIGFIPLEYEFMDRSEGGGIRFLESECLEWSFCSIPANPSAVITQRLLRDGGGGVDALALARRAAATVERLQARLAGPLRQRAFEDDESERVARVAELRATVAAFRQDEAIDLQQRLGAARLQRMARW